MRCTCSASEGPHHHQFGGTYPCEGPQACKRCHDEDARFWTDQLNRPDDATQQTLRGHEYIRRRYGGQTARALYGR